MICTNENCSAYAKCFAPYRGSTCKATRATYGLGDPMTNADRIRQMTDEELANFLDRWEMGDFDYSKTFCNLCDGQYDCHDDCLMDWLKAPVEEVQDGT